MPFIVLAIGAILLIAALNNSQSALAAALETDVPAYLRWALAIVLIGGLGFVPGMKPISRGLMALVLVVIVLKNYQALGAGLTGATQGVPAAASTGTDGVGGLTTVPGAAQSIVPPALQGLGELGIGAGAGYM